MKEPSQHQVDDTALPPLQSVAGLTTEQQDALAKVYRLLLAHTGEKTKADESKNHSLAEHSLDTDQLDALAINQTNE